MVSINKAPDMWTGMAAFYEKYFEPLSCQFLEATLSLAGNVRTGEDVLDVAAGPGALTLAAARLGACVLGIDSSPAMVAHLSKRLEKENCGNCEARVMDGEALELPDASFDAAFSMFGIVTFADWRRGLFELARVVRPGGRGCITGWTRAEGAGAARLLVEAYPLAFPEAGPLPTPPGFRALMTADALQVAMGDAGFKDVVVHTADGVYELESADLLMNTMEPFFGQIPFYGALDEDGRERIRDAMRSVARHYQTPDGFTVPTAAHIAVGRR